MLASLKPFAAIMSLVIALLIGGGATGAESKAVALKSGETVEIGNVFWVVNCRSLMKGLPVVEVLEAPPGITVSVREQMVIPRALNCAKEVPGGILLLTAAKNISERRQGKLMVRIKFQTVDGERQGAREFDVTLFP